LRRQAPPRDRRTSSRRKKERKIDP
jgi:hypothetical protein